LISSDTALAGTIAAAANDALTVVSNTYTMTKAQYSAWSVTSDNMATTAAANKATALANTSVNDPYFQFFYCGGSQDHIYTCYKFQPTSGTDGKPRFDTDSSGAKALH
jgi:1,2-phenylacetyl-CoA epoxidase PaaB subunit